MNHVIFLGLIHYIRSIISYVMFSTYMSSPEGAEADRCFTISAHNRFYTYFFNKWRCCCHSRRGRLIACIACQLAKWIHDTVTAFHAEFVTIDTFINTRLGSHRSNKKFEKLHFLWISLKVCLLKLVTPSKIRLIMYHPPPKHSPPPGTINITI